MKKNKKKYTGVVVLLAGVLLFVFAKYEMHRVGDAKASYSRDTSMFSGNAVSNAVGGYVEGRLSQYDTPLKLCEIGGIILIILGAGILYLNRKKK